MAGVKFRLPSGEVSLTGGTAKTVLTVKAASNHRVLLKGLSVFFKGTSATDTPAKIEVSRITTDGGTATTVTAAKNDESDSETIQTTGKANYTVEPTTYGNNVETWEVHPQTGLMLFLPLGDEIAIDGGNELGIRVTAAQNQTVSVNAYCEE